MAHKNSSNYSPYKARQQKRNSQRDPSTGSIPKGGENSSLRPTSHSPRGRGQHRRPDQIFELEEATDRLTDIFRNHGAQSYINFVETRQLARYYRLLMQNQEINNFTRLLKLRDIGIRHFIDCLLITQLIPLKFPLLDLGTGPGLPGIPLKIHFPEEKILLAEGVQKRVEFLKTVRSELDLKNLDIIGRNINSEFVYPIQGVITRAVEDIPNTLRNVSGCLQVGGQVYFMKGPGVDPELELFKKNSSASKFYALEKDIAYELPHTPHKRRFLVFTKTRETPWDPADEDLRPSFDPSMRTYLKDRGEEL